MDPNNVKSPSIPELVGLLQQQQQQPGEEDDEARFNAASYLQHLSYKNENNKNLILLSGSIPVLIRQMEASASDLRHVLARVLQNLTCGISNPDIKLAIADARGVTTFSQMLLETTDPVLAEILTGILWNLSSVPKLKRSISDNCLNSLTEKVVIPYAEDLMSGTDADHDLQRFRIFRNATGILKNLSSGNVDTRRMMRESDGLIEAVLVIVCASISSKDVDNNKAVENCVCLLRNLSYACHEMAPLEHARCRTVKYRCCCCCRCRCDRRRHGTATGNSRSKLRLSCLFGCCWINRRSVQNCSDLTCDGIWATRGMALLWQPEIIRIYLPLLAESRNYCILEACLGAIQNLTAGKWQPAVDLRASIRKEKGLPIVIDLLCSGSTDSIVRSASVALRNLALDEKNKELIGRYAIGQLIERLPEPMSVESTSSGMHDGANESSVESVIHDLVQDNAVNARLFIEGGGVSKLFNIVEHRSFFCSRTVTFAVKILKLLWSHRDLHETYKRNGWSKRDFQRSLDVGRSSKVKFELFSTSVSSTDNNSRRCDVIAVTSPSPSSPSHDWTHI